MSDERLVRIALRLFSFPATGSLQESRAVQTCDLCFKDEHQAAFSQNGLCVRASIVERRYVLFLLRLLEQTGG